MHGGCWLRTPWRHQAGTITIYGDVRPVAPPTLRRRHTTTTFTATIIIALDDMQSDTQAAKEAHAFWAKSEEDNHKGVVSYYLQVLLIRSN